MSELALGQSFKAGKAFNRKIGSPISRLPELSIIINLAAGFAWQY
jgi:hypothetical protein